MKPTIFYNLFAIISVLIYFTFFSFAQSPTKTDSLIQNSQDDTTKAKLLNKLGWELMYQNPDTSILLSKNALSVLAAFANDEHIKQSIELIHSINKLIAYTHSNLGVYYGLKGNYPKSLSYHLKALEIRKKLNDKKGIAASLCNIGIVYRNQNDYSNALKYYREALKIDKELGDNAGIAADLGNIGTVYRNQNDYSNALKYYQEALKIGKELGDKNRIAIQLGNIGVVYMDQGDYPNALKYYKEALEIAKELENQNGIARHLGNIGSLCFLTGKHAEAEQYLTKALVLADSIGYLIVVRDINQSLSQLYDTTARYQLACQHYKKYSETKDSLFNEEKSKEIGRLEQKHEFAIAEMERIRIMNEKLKTMNEKIKRRNLLQYSGIVLALFFLFIGIFLFAKRFRKIKEEKTYLRYVKIIGGALFVAFLILFEFIIVLLEPYIEKYTGGEPAFKLFANAILASVIFPLHSFLEAKLKATVIKQEGISPNEKNGGQEAEDQSWTKKKNHCSNTTLLMIGYAIISFAASTHQPINPSSKTDSLVQNFRFQISNSKNDTTKINVLNALGTELMYLNPDSSISFSKQALFLAERLPVLKDENNELPTGQAKVRLKLIANSHSNLGVFYWLKGDYPQALSYHRKALETREKFKEKKGIAKSLVNIGIVYANQGDYPSALKYYFKSLKINEELGRKIGIAANLTNIGILYKEQNNYAQALEYHFKALKIDEELENKNGISADFSNIGIIYKSQGNYTKAFEYFFKALKIDEELINKNGIARNLTSIGMVFYEQGDSIGAAGKFLLQKERYSKSSEYYFNALKINKELGKKIGIAINFGNIGMLYAKTKCFADAETYLDSALKLCDSIGSLNYTMIFEKSISELYSNTSRHKLALLHYKKYSAAKDSLYNEDKSKEIGRIEMRQEFEMAELNRIRIMNDELRILNKKINRRNLLQYSGILLALVFLFGVVFFVGKIPLPEWVVSLLTIVPFMILFEFMLVLIDPYIENYTGGVPIFKLLINAVCALTLFPMHSFMERKLKTRIEEIKRKKEKQFAEEFRREVDKFR